MFRKKTTSRPGSRKSPWPWAMPNSEENLEGDPFSFLFRPPSATQNSSIWGSLRPKTRDKKNKEESVNRKIEDLSVAEKLNVLRHPLVRLTQSYENLLLHKFLRITFAQDDLAFYFPWKFWYTERGKPVEEVTVYRQSQLDTALDGFKAKESSTLYLMRELAKPEFCEIGVIYRISRSRENELIHMVASMVANGTLLQPKRVSGT